MRDHAPQFLRRAKRQPHTIEREQIDDDNTHVTWKEAAAFAAMLLAFLAAFMGMTR